MSCFVKYSLFNGVKFHPQQTSPIVSGRSPVQGHPNYFVPTVNLHHKTLNDPMKRHILVAHLLEERKGGRSSEDRVVWQG